jgi:hypothetical protein
MKIQALVISEQGAAEVMSMTDVEIGSLGPGCSSKLAAEERFAVFLPTDSRDLYRHPKRLAGAAHRELESGFTVGSSIILP